MAFGEGGGGPGGPGLPAGGGMEGMDLYPAPERQPGSAPAAPVDATPHRCRAAFGELSDALHR